MSLAASHKFSLIAATKGPEVFNKLSGLVLDIKHNRKLTCPNESFKALPPTKKSVLSVK